MGQWNARGAGDAGEAVGGGVEGSGCANWKTRAGHGVTVGILVTRPDRLPRLRAPRDVVFSFSSLRKGRFFSRVAFVRFPER